MKLFSWRTKLTTSPLEPKQDVPQGCVRRHQSCTDRFHYEFVIKLQVKTCSTVAVTVTYLSRDTNGCRMAVCSLDTTYLFRCISVREAKAWMLSCSALRSAQCKFSSAGKTGSDFTDRWQIKVLSLSVGWNTRSSRWSVDSRWVKFGTTTRNPCKYKKWFLVNAFCLCDSWPLKVLGRQNSSLCNRQVLMSSKVFQRLAA